jgi:polyhydroxybutyrate depolymerase
MRSLTSLALALALAAGVAACGGGDAPIERPVTFGGDRPVQLQVPAGFSDDGSYPLVMILHGYGAGGFVQQNYLMLGDLADREDVLVLAPDGLVDSTNRQYWNADPACCDFASSGVDDVAYLGGLIDDVMASWPVDRSRVALIGHSNGSFMAYRMACDRADVVTQIAGLAGLGPTTPCTPSQPVQVLHIHGTADSTVPYEGGDFGSVRAPGAVATVAAFATRNGCQGAPAGAGTKDLDSNLDGAETTVAVTGDCPATGAADLWTIEGGAHLPALSAGFDDELTGWLRAHPRP